MIGKKLQKALGIAVEELKRRRHEYLTLEHVLYGIASEPSGRKLIERCGGSAPVLRQALDHFFKTYLESLDEPTKDVYQTLAVQRVLDSALAHVNSAGRDEDIGVEVGDVLAAILEEEEYSWAAYCLKKQGITRLAVLESISHNDEEGQDESSSESGEGEGGAESAKDALARYTVDLTARAREGKLDPLVGREMELSRSIEILARRRKNNPLYVGDPGTGKTAIAEGLALRIVSGNVPPEFKDTKIYSLDLGAVLAGARYRGDFEGRIKAVVGALQKIPGAILFIDEIHRFSKSQQDSLLNAVETGVVTLIGATTENPSFEVIRPLLSRCQVYVLKSLEKADLLTLLNKAVTEDIILKDMNIVLAETDAMLRYSGGDARKLLNILELVVAAEEGNEKIEITDEKVVERLQENPAAYDKGGEMHYDIISAFIKSIRGSDPDAAVYWLARMVAGGEDPEFIARRLVISASEDIGLANPNALLLANACFDALKKIGWPEGRIILAETTVYLACCPKSNSAYMAINDALELVNRTGNLPVPLHLRNAPTKLMAELNYGKDYKYAHDYENHFVKQEFLPKEILNERLWKGQENPSEHKLIEQMRRLWGDRYQN